MTEYGKLMLLTGDKQDRTFTVWEFSLDNRWSMANVSRSLLLISQFLRIFSICSVVLAEFEIASMSSGIFQ